MTMALLNAHPMQSRPRGWLAVSPDRLTPREREVLTLLVHRFTDSEIAERLSISRRTASHHVGRILAKLGVANRREAGAIAARLGLGLA